MKKIKILISLAFFMSLSFSSFATYTTYAYAEDGASDAETAYVNISAFTYIDYSLYAGADLDEWEQHQAGDNAWAKSTISGSFVSYMVEATATTTDMTDTDVISGTFYSGASAFSIYAKSRTTTQGNYTTAETYTVIDW